jgi:hypothetical protein
MNPTPIATPLPTVAEPAGSELELDQAEADRRTLQVLLHHAHDARRRDEEAGAHPVILCHHAELLSLLIRRLAETELRIVEARLGRRRIAG